MTHSDQLKLKAKAVHEATYGDKPKHTPEPWKLNDEFPVNDTTGSAMIEAETEYKRIAKFCAYEFWDCSIEETNANAARVVSCINALAGIPDPAKFVDKAKKDATKVVVLSHELDEMYEAVTYCLDNSIPFKSVQEAVDKFQKDDDGNDPANQADFANKLKKEG